MDASTLSNQQLVDHIEAAERVPKTIIDEYYRRCIPIYRDFLGIHWHTGLYRDDKAPISTLDQVRMVDHIASSIDISSRDRVLDVGCGMGATICHLNKVYGCEVVGLTPVQEQVELAGRLAETQQALIRVDRGHAESLPYPNQSFDVVTCFESPCHFDDRQAFFDEVYRVLKPGGRLAGEDWLAVDLSNSAKSIEWIEPVCKTWAIPMLGDATEYRRLMKSAKLENVTLIDMKKLMPLHKGFAVSEDDLQALESEIRTCHNPLLGLILKGLVRLGMAVRENAFTIGQFSATKSVDSRASCSAEDKSR